MKVNDYTIRLEGFDMNDKDSWIPVFGKWCGPGWTAGERVKSRLSENPIQAYPFHCQEPNQIDNLCCQHDHAYASAQGNINEKALKLAADVALLKALALLDLNTLTKAEKWYLNVMKIAFPLKNGFLNIAETLAEQKALNRFLIAKMNRAVSRIRTTIQDVDTKKQEKTQLNEEGQKNVDPDFAHSSIEEYAQSLLGGFLNELNGYKERFMAKTQKKFMQDLTEKEQTKKETKSSRPLHQTRNYA